MIEVIFVGSVNPDVVKIGVVLFVALHRLPDVCLSYLGIVRTWAVWQSTQRSLRRILAYRTFVWIFFADQS